MDRVGSRVLPKAVRLIEACRLAIFLPSIPDVSILAPGVDALPWPRWFVGDRAVRIGSRRSVATVEASEVDELDVRITVEQVGGPLDRHSDQIELIQVVL